MAACPRKRSLINVAKIVIILIILVYIIRLLFHIKQSRNLEKDSEKWTLINRTSANYSFYKKSFSEASEGSWHYISEQADTYDKFLAFSAFFDRRKNEVTLIAVTRTKRRRETVLCKYWYEKNYGNVNELYTSTNPARIQIIQEHWQLDYSAYYIHCPLNKDLPIPTAVSLLLEDFENVPRNLFKIINNSKLSNIEKSEQTNSKSRKFAVCVKPLHYDYNKDLEILEFIELHRLMGVEHFFLYNHTVGPQVDCILKQYIEEGVVTVLPWDLPIVSQQEIRTEGIFASLNDCLYRTMFMFSHVILVDFDEFIIPRNHYNYNDFFDYIEKRDKTNLVGAYMFKNAFFYRQFLDDPESHNLNEPLAAALIVLRKTRRRADFFPYRVRSKYIIKPEVINMVGNHFIWEYLEKKYRTLNIDTNDGILHHYRKCELGGDDCIKKESVVDKSAYKYKDDLLRAVGDRFERMRHKCDIKLVIGSF